MPLFRVFIPDKEPQLIRAREIKMLIKKTAVQYPKCRVWTVHRDPFGEVKVWTCQRTEDGNIVYYGGGDGIKHVISTAQKTERR